MRRRWRLILPIYGLLLFVAITISSIRRTDHQRRIGEGSRYFWWGAVRLDSDPQNRHPRAPILRPCENGEPNCVTWDPEPGILERIIILSAIPAFLIEAGALAASSRLGINQIPVFMISMPILIVTWFYFLGWLIDRWRYKRRQSPV